jgi:hypothetical protein
VGCDVGKVWAVSVREVGAMRLFWGLMCILGPQRHTPPRWSLDLLFLIELAQRCVHRFQNPELASEDQTDSRLQMWIVSKHSPHNEKPNAVTPQNFGSGW